MCVCVCVFVCVCVCVCVCVTAGHDEEACITLQHLALLSEMAQGLRGRHVGRQLLQRPLHAHTIEREVLVSMILSDGQV
jgi:hypothetical protein